MKRKLLLAACLVAGALGFNANASTDITSSYLKNADLSTVNYGWTYFSDAYKYTDWKTDGDVPVVEFYSQWNDGAPVSMNRKDFKFSQTVTMPAGYYRLAVNAFYRNGTGDGTNDDKAWIFVKGTGIEKSQNVAALTSAGVGGYTGGNDLYRAANAFSLGDFSNAFDFKLDAETEVEIGFQGYFNLSLSWCILGPVKLYKYTAEDYMSDYTTKVTEAEALYSLKMNATVLSELQAAVVDESTLLTVDDVFNAVQALTNAIAAANTSIVKYDEAKTILDAANIYDAAGQASYAADETVAAIQTAYDNGTLVAVNDEQKTAAKAALATACKAQTQPADNCDMTAYIVNPGIDGNVNGWTCDMNANGGYVGGPLKPSNDAMEFWGAGTLTDEDKGKSFDYYQTITSLPEGAYTISADMLNSTNGESGANWNGGGNAGLYGKTASDEVQVLITIDGETFLPYTTDEILVIDGNLRIGVKNINPLTGRWFACDNFKLTYARQLTDDEKEVIAKENAVAKYNEAFAAAQAIVDGTIPDPAYTNLQTVITNNMLAADGTEGTSSEYNAAATALNEAATAAAELVEPYAAWKPLKAYADALVAVTNDNAEANSTLASVISAQTTAVNNATTAEAITNATSILKTAMVTYAGTANPVGEGKKFDITFMLTNPDLTGYSWTKVEGWDTEQTFPSQNCQAMYTAGEGYYYEYWSDNSNPVSGYTIYLKNVTLPEGTYQMTAKAKAGWGGGATNPNGAQAITFSAGETDGTNITSATLADAQLDFVQATEGEVKIGLKAHEGNTCNWMGIGYVKLYKVPAITVEISENANYTPESVAGKVTLTRTLSTENWNTFVVPFQITEAELKVAFGDGVAVAEFSEVADGTNSTINFSTMATPAITPNKPVLLKPSTVAPDNKYVFENRTVATGEAEVVGTNFNFVGTYAASTDIAAGNYFISKDKLYKSAGGTTIKGTRAYLKANIQGGEVKVRFVIDDETATSIEGIEFTENVENGKIYDISGRMVTRPVKGLYIKNGKKFIVK